MIPGDSQSTSNEEPRSMDDNMTRLRGKKAKYVIIVAPPRGNLYVERKLDSPG